MDVGALEASVRGFGAQLSVHAGQLHVGTDAGLIVDIPVELVLQTTLAEVNGEVQLALSMLAPTSVGGRCASCIPRVVAKRHVLTRAQWTNRHDDTATAGLGLVTIVARLPLAAAGKAEVWADEVHALAYAHTRALRRVLVLCNPASGQGKGRTALDADVRPMLEAAGCEVSVLETEKRYDAFRIAHTLEIHTWDVLVCVGGDGTLHEVVNGLASRDDALDALRLPLVPVPCGSGNGMYVSLHGTHTMNRALACLSAIKGRPHTQELCTVTQDAALFSAEQAQAYPLRGSTAGKAYVQYYTFLSQNMGLLADVDLGTEAFRFLGDLRFTLGYVLGALHNRRYDLQLEVLLGSHGGTDKAAMRAHTLQGAPAQRKRGKALHALQHGSVLDEHTVSPAPLDFASGTNPRDTWVEVALPVSSLYGGKMPYVGRDMMVFPYAHPADGTVDLLLQLRDASLWQKLDAMTHIDKGDHIFGKSIRYAKVEAFRVVPGPQKRKNQYLSMDGEAVPYGAFQVEVSTLSIQLMSLDDKEWHAPILHPPAVHAHADRP